MANLFNFLFNLFMSRNLKVEEYGVLISIVSLITMLSIAVGAVTPTIITVAGAYFAKNDMGHLHAFYYKLFKPLLILSAILIIIFIITSRNIGEFFHIKNNFYLILTAIATSFIYISTLNSSFLQAKLDFRSITFINAISALIKFIIGFACVLIGFGLNGAIFGLFLSLIMPAILGLYFLSKVIFYKKQSEVLISTKELLSFGIPSAVIILCLNSFITTDILLVKHLFSDFSAGQYAGLSLVGRVIFFLVTPIITVMFPMIINRLNTGKDYRIILSTSVLLVGGLASFLTMIYFFIPEFTILFFLKKQEYLSLSNVLGKFGIFITIYSLVYLISQYFLSRKLTKIIWPLTIGAIAQILLIYFNHSSFETIINISIIVVFSLLIVLSFYFIKSKDI